MFLVVIYREEASNYSIYDRGYTLLAMTSSACSDCSDIFRDVIDAMEACAVKRAAAAAAAPPRHVQLTGKTKDDVCLDPIIINVCTVFMLIDAT